MSHVAINRDHWNADAPNWATAGEYAWAAQTPSWGIWATPDDEAPMIPADMSGLTAVELGCGTGYISAWMTRRGATVTGVDISGEQLATARRLSDKHSLAVTFIEANAEDTGLPAESFDFAISEYGAATWCDPDLWLREAHRLLRHGGRLSFLTNHPLMLITTPLSGDINDHTLHRPYRDLAVMDWTTAEVEPGGVSFTRPIAGWFALFRKIGFVVEDFRELYARENHEGIRFAVPADWARDYPAEMVWWLRKS